MAYKHDYDTKLFRRTQIIAKLYNGAKLTHKELAEELKISINTSKSQLLKARRYLRNELEKLHKERI